MRQLSCSCSILIMLIVLGWCLSSCTPEGVEPAPDPPLVTTTSVDAGLPTTTPPEPPDPPTSRPQDYIQWTCHASKPRCIDRFKKARELDLAYHVDRGHRDLEYLRDRGRMFLKGGARALVDLTVDKLVLVINKMAHVDARGNRLIFRIENQQHRDFDANPLGDWHRSQVRVKRANAMRDELKAQTAIYGEIASSFPPVKGCDSIRCKVKKLKEQSGAGA